jgi:hypothetical protein
MARTTTPEVKVTESKSTKAGSAKGTRPEVIVKGGADGGSEMVLVANQHTGNIMLPRKGGQGISLPPIILHAGHVTPVPRDEWNERKKIQVVQYYLDRNLLAEVRREGVVPVIDATSTELTPPEHLQSEEEQGVHAKAGVRKANTAEVKI